MIANFSSPARLIVGAFTLAALSTMPFGTAAAQTSSRFASSKPQPRVEYWQERLAEIDNELRTRKDLSSVKLVFIGDSITDFWLMDEDRWVKGQFAGRKVWDRTFAGHPPENLAINLGISGDRIEHVLYRLLPRSAGGLGHLDAADLDPDFVVLMLGINNTWAAEDPVVDSILAGVRAVLVSVHERKPRARIVLQSILPTNDAVKNHTVVLPANEGLRLISESAAFAGFTTYLDLYPSFVDARGQQIPGYFNDGLHPSTAGYAVWGDQLESFLKLTRAASSSSRAQ